MARTQIAFRLDAEKASQFKQQAEAEGKSLNVILETFVNAYLEGKLITEGNSELTTGNSEGGAIALLTERIAQLEKLLTPVTELLTLNQPRPTVNTKLASANTESRANFGFAANNEVTSANTPEGKQTVNNKLTDVSTNDEVTSVSTPESEDNVNNELTDVSTNDEVTSANSKLASVSTSESENDVNNKVTDGNNQESKQTVNNKVTSVSTSEDKQAVSSELTDGNSGNESASVSNEVTSVSTKDEVISVNSKLADVSREDNVNHELTDGNSSDELASVTSEEDVNHEVTSGNNSDELTPVSTEEGSAIAATPTENLEPLPKNTPSETTPETAKDTIQDDSPLKPPKPLETAKIEESAIEVGWMNQEEALNRFRVQYPPLLTIKKHGNLPNGKIQEHIRKNNIVSARNQDKSYFLFDRLIVEFKQVKERGKYEYRIVAGEPDRGITKNTLAKRLNIYPRDLNKNLEKGEAHFKEWIKSKDPDGYAWRYSSITGRFHVIAETSS